MKSICLLALISLVKANIYFDLNSESYESVKNSRNFTGKVVLITGSSSGIGHATAKLFSILGANVVINGRNSEEVNKVAQEVQQLSPNKLKPLEVVADVTKSDDLNRLLNETIETFGKLDVLVNNAGILSNAGVKETNFMPVFDQTIQIDLRSALELTHMSAKYLDKTNGTIINVSSYGSLVPHASALAYTVAKAGLDMATKVLALELGPGIRVNAVNPGVILTEIFTKSPTPTTKAIQERAEKNTPLKRLGEPLDVAKGIVFLASTDASFITGANLVIDGGLVHNDSGNN